MSLFYMKPLVDTLLWDKHDGDGKSLLAYQSMTSGLMAGFMGPISSGNEGIILISDGCKQCASWYEVSELKTKPWYFCATPA